MGTEILLATINGRYQHASLGLRYLFANLAELKPKAEILEFTLSQGPREIAEAVLSRSPRIVGLGVYIWNARQTYDIVSVLKRVSPGTIVVLGGPEVSHESGSQPICRLADFTIQGEADFLFADLCRELLTASGPEPGKSSSNTPETTRYPFQKIISGGLPDLNRIASPYAYYTDEDLRHRVLYVEASRGCPYKCEYCLSSLDTAVRNFDPDRFLADMDRLIGRGARQFKFVDRTFNLKTSTAVRIMNFFLERAKLGLFLHFEMVPDRLPVELRELIRQFPPGSLQFEIGIQSWNPEVAERVSRKQDYQKIRGNFRFLKEETSAHLHADLIAGLPGETLESFAAGFDALAALGPDEIQLGILKKLKGTPIARHDLQWSMVYEEHPPYRILSTSTMSFETIQRLNRFADFWDRFANSGNFKKMMSLFREIASRRPDGSLFRAFHEFSLFLEKRHAHGHGVSLLNLVESAWLYLTGELGLDPERVADTLIADYAGEIRRDIPDFLRGKDRTIAPHTGASKSGTPRRQKKHLPDRA